MVERDEAIKLTLLSVLAQENIILVGAPGTGKSFLARKIADSFATQADDPNRYYEYLLTKFSTPEELFGPLSISELKADRFKRNTTGYLPSVQLAFLDEVFKASSSILNSLLTILNERIYHNGAQVQNVPLQALIAASNELPTENIELNALYDRFLVRHFVDYVSDANLHRLFDLSSNQSTPSDTSNHSTTPLMPELLNDLFKLSRTVTLPPDIQTIIQAIWLEHKTLFKEDDREQLSDRRLKKVLGLLQVSAASNARTKIDLSDVFLLKHCLWNHPDNIQAVSKLVLKHLNLATGKEEVAIEKSATQATPLQVKEPIMVAHYEYGLKGSGTENDPFIIDNAADFARLNDPNIGEYGFYFKQVTDISTIPVNQKTTDFERAFGGMVGVLVGIIGTPKGIKFTGTYDGNGFSFNKKNYIFEKLNNATIKNLYIKAHTLANLVENNSLIINCEFSMINHRTNDKFDNGYDACAVYQLRNSTIQSCFINLTKAERNNSVHNSSSGTIQNCFIKRKSNSELIKGNTINSSNNITNISDSNDPNSANGQHIKFSVDFFDRCKDQLKWDFEKVWEWDNASNEPYLQKNQNAKQAIPEEPVKDLPKTKVTLNKLTQQLNNNIWLSH